MRLEATMAHTGISQQGNLWEANAKPTKYHIKSIARDSKLTLYEEMATTNHLMSG